MSAQDIAPDKLESPQTFDDSPEALGATLAEARNRLGLEQREVATRLGLNPVLIRHLEEGAFGALGAAVYVRGYLSRYARFLDLSEQEILERHKRLGMNELPPLRVARPIKPQARMKDTVVGWFSYLLVFAIIGGVGWQGYKQVADHLESADDLPPLLRALTGNDRAGLALPKPETPPDSAQNSAPQSAAPATASTDTQPLAKPAAETAKPTAQVESPSATPAKPAPLAVPTPETTAATSITTIALPMPKPAAVPETPVPSPISSPQTQVVAEQPAPPASEPVATMTPSDTPQLVIAFSQDCWVEVKDANGQRVAYGIMKANTVNTVSGSGPFSVTLGNAVGVSEIKLNGKPVEQSVYIPRRGTVSRFTLGTPSPL
ncbi:MAG: DUF4115 domain-containing protein [Gammaproteobacteria bacterium]|nr:DUF4115 domain-containing protein [Gammaproteobacteria bacterium]MCP5458496.1 DUF4115 domain-containing protein [Gammaproteobacteria bacterium]